jgi:hypothetical protein
MEKEPPPPVPLEYEVGWTSEPVWTTWRRANSLLYRDSKSDPSLVQSIASNSCLGLIMRCDMKGKDIRFNELAGCNMVSFARDLMVGLHQAKVKYTRFIRKVQSPAPVDFNPGHDRRELPCNCEIF